MPNPSETAIVEGFVEFVEDARIPMTERARRCFMYLGAKPATPFRPSSMPRLLELDPSVKAALLNATVINDVRAWSPVVVALTADVDPVVRALATSAVGSLGIEGEEERLRTLLRDPDRRVAMQAIYALRAIGVSVETLQDRLSASGSAIAENGTVRVNPGYAGTAPADTAARFTVLSTRYLDGIPAIDASAPIPVTSPLLRETVFEQGVLGKELPRFYYERRLTGADSLILRPSQIQELPPMADLRRLAITEEGVTYTLTDGTEATRAWSEVVLAAAGFIRPDIPPDVPTTSVVPVIEILFRHPAQRARVIGRRVDLPNTNAGGAGNVEAISQEAVVSNLCRSLVLHARTVPVTEWGCKFPLARFHKEWIYSMFGSLAEWERYVLWALHVVSADLRLPWKIPDSTE
jgi:hypothetical protein